MQLLAVTHYTKTKIKRLAESYHLSLIVLFGSQAEGRIHRESDIDIAVLGEKPLSVEQEILIITNLCQILKSDRIDVVNISRASPLLLKEIFSKPVVLYQKSPDILYEYELYALRRYTEAEPLYKLVNEELGRRVGAL